MSNTTNRCTCGDNTRYVSTSLTTGTLTLYYTPVDRQYGCEYCAKTDNLTYISPANYFVF